MSVKDGIKDTGERLDRLLLILGRRIGEDELKASSFMTRPYVEYVYKMGVYLTGLDATPQNARWAAGRDQSQETSRLV